MRARTVALGACGAAALAVILPALLRGEGIFPVALLSALPPWNQTMHGQRDPLLQDQALQFWPWRLFLWDGSVRSPARSRSACWLRSSRSSRRALERRCTRCSSAAVDRAPPSPE